jgi:N-acetylneuraminate lyase
MAIHPFAGMYTALLTPLHENGSLNLPLAQKLLLHLTSLGLDGAYIAGTTGEGMRLSLENRKALLESLMEVLPGDKRIFVHVGTPNVRDAIKLAEHAGEQGAHAISSLPPAVDSVAVLEFYKELAANSPLPLIVYYFPKAAPLAFQNSKELLDICDLPNVLGVKFTDFNLYLLNRLTKSGKLVFNGYDEALAAGLLMGAQGGIGTTYNLLAPVALDIYRASKIGDWETARSLQNDVNGVLDILFRYPFFPAVRESVRHMGFDCGPMASGEAFATESDRTRFIEDMNQNLPESVLSRIEWQVSREIHV